MKKVLIIGDSCIDVFVYGNCKRLSPEAPVPILNPINTVVNDGMAYNVYRNVKSLGVFCNIVTNDDKPRKTRYVEKESNQTLLRVDENDVIERISQNELLGIDFKEFDAVIISDYNKGFLSEEDIEFISTQHNWVFMDSKKKLGNWCSFIDVIKINEKEQISNMDWIPENYNKYLIVTLGSRGSMYNNVIYPIEEIHPVRDLSGAGDTYLAALVAEFLKSTDMEKAIKFANKCASWVVTQKGVTVVDLNKMK
jgi:bifunctional ADP-heptose synthase (sugar kinase/adenylyltransferase)